MVTVELDVGFRRLALLGRPLELIAWTHWVEGRELHLSGEIRDQGQLIARAHGLFLEVDEEHFLGSADLVVPTWSREGHTARDLEQHLRAR